MTRFPKCTTEPNQEDIKISHFNKNKDKMSTLFTPGLPNLIHCTGVSMLIMHVVPKVGTVSRKSLVGDLVRDGMFDTTRKVSK